MAKGFRRCYLLLLFLISTVWAQYNDQIEENFAAQNQTSIKYYINGVDKGLINPEKYPYESFLRDEQNVFKDLYQEYTSFNEAEPISYEEWLIMNNYGLLSDTQESLFDKKITKRSAGNKRRFVNAVRKGDILITGRGIGGLVGHAAIMTTNNYVLEMRGGKGWEKGIRSNNRQVTKHRWFDEHQHDWTTVYRVPNANAAYMAATWADRTYYNPSGGAKKTKHITYFINIDVWKTNPSYCSKLVVQAYYFGTGRMKVINPNAMRVKRVIVPTQIPTYFRPNFRPRRIGKF